AIVERYGVANLLIATAMAGVLMFGMGALRMGQLIRYIPVSIVTGFTSGIAVIIAMQQLKDFLGLSIPKMPANFFSQLGALWDHLHTVNWSALWLGVASLAVVEFMLAVTGIRPANRLLRYRADIGTITRSSDPPLVGCYYCAALR
ncbi:MAG TPA: SulP family inorganic anion transporter, partial [Burkholderiaceae bacterium]|nr:SulP family inorganic anion transporter [Burkholderiaceae bacterium]